jgi:beta-lactamase class A
MATSSRWKAPPWLARVAIGLAVIGLLVVVQWVGQLTSDTKPMAVLIQPTSLPNTALKSSPSTQAVGNSGMQPAAGTNSAIPPAPSASISHATPMIGVAQMSSTAQPLNFTAVALAVTSTPASKLPPELNQKLASILDEVTGTFGIVVYDKTLNDDIYQLNAEKDFYAASLIKLPIAFTLYSMADQKQIDLNKQLTTTAADMVPGTGSIQGAPLGSSYTLRDLSRRMISESDNVAANLLLKELTFDRVNQRMQQIGATHTKVERLFFDDQARLAGKDIRTSPKDMALLLGQLLTNATLTKPSADEILAAMLMNIDDTKIPALLPPDAKIWHKTGAIEGLEHDVGIIQVPSGRQYTLVIMSETSSGNQASIEAIAAASRLIYDYEKNLPS